MLDMGLFYELFRNLYSKFMTASVSEKKAYNNKLCEKLKLKLVEGDMMMYCEIP
jgi:hypothetical protein